MIDILPLPADCMKTRGCQLSPDGTVISGSYASEDYKKEGRPVIKTFTWTKKNGVKVTGKEKKEKELTDSQRIANYKKYLKDAATKKPSLFEEWRDKHLLTVKSQIGEWVSGFAYGAITPDGSLVVGALLRKNTLDKPFFWREDMGAVLFQDFLKDVPLPPNYDASGFVPDHISADGTAIVGSYWNKGKDSTEIFRIHNPNGFGKNGKLIGIDFNELGVKGAISAVGKGQWTVVVSEIIAPSGEATPLSPPRPKVVLIPKGLVVPTGAKVGAKVRVIGADAGPGKPLNARSIEIAPQ